MYCNFLWNFGDIKLCIETFIKTTLSLSILLHNSLHCEIIGSKKNTLEIFDFDFSKVRNIALDFTGMEVCNFDDMKEEDLQTILMPISSHLFSKTKRLNKIENLVVKKFYTAF